LRRVVASEFCPLGKVLLSIVLGKFESGLHDRVVAVGIYLKLDAKTFGRLIFMT